MNPRSLALLLALVGGLGYFGLSYLLFEMPQSAAAAEDCGFLPEEFVAAGKLTYERGQAWWISFQRKEEIFSLLSVAAALGFVGFALEHFRAKWTPVRVKKMRQNKEIERFRDSKKSGNALAAGRRNGAGATAGAALGGGVLDWHVEDRDGNRSLDLGGPAVRNVDLVLGQGRVTGQAILKDVGKAMLARGYQVAALLAPAGAQAASVPVPTPAGSAQAATLSPQTAPTASGLSAGLLGALAIAAAAIGAIGFELGRRRGNA